MEFDLEKPPQERSGSQRSLAISTLLQMALRITLVVIAVTWLSYWHIVNTLEDQTVDKLEKYIVERAQRESAIFQLATDNQHTLKDIFLRSWLQVKGSAHTQYSDYFETSEDGATRLKSDLFFGATPTSMVVDEHVSGFVGLNAPVTDPEFQSRLVLSYKMVNQFGPSYKHRFANLYFHMPENVNIVYWPGLPWGLQAKTDLDMTQEEWMYIAFQKNNPARDTVWTGLYFDPTADEWMISCSTPVDYEGKHLVTIGHDILLNDLFNRVFDDRLAGANNFIIRTDSRLVAHPEKTKELRDAAGVLYLNQLQDATLESIYADIVRGTSTGKSAGIVSNKISDAFIAYAPIKGPGWIFVTVYPKALLASSAKSAAQFILALGVISLIIELIMLYVVLRKQVIKPVDQFVAASQSMAQGNYENARTDIATLSARKDEMGLMARTFNYMAKRIENYQNDLQASVDNRTQELSQLAAQLKTANTELEKLTYIDSLTQIANKRQFNEGYEEEWRRAARQRTALHLMMVDIDFFKNYNDTYGHVQGDACIKKIAETLKQHIARAGDIVARVGGEEFAVLLPNSTHEDALKMGEKLVASIEALQIPHAKSSASQYVTISIGLATHMPTKDQDPLVLVEAADAALYRAKAAGRNRVEK